MVRIIISNKVCWGNAETDTAIAPVVVSIFTDLLLGTQLIKQRNWFISFNKNLLAELKKRLKISIFLWRKSCASR